MIHFRHVGHVQAVLHELSPQEPINQKDLADDVDQILKGCPDEPLDDANNLSAVAYQQLTKEEDQSIARMTTPILIEIRDELVNLFLFYVLRHDGHVQALDQGLHLPTLLELPQVVRGIEQQGLEEESEANPLVVLVVPTVDETGFNDLWRELLPWSSLLT